MINLELLGYILKIYVLKLGIISGVLSLRSDNAKEYFSSSFSEFMTHSGIVRLSACPYTPPKKLYC